MAAEEFENIHDMFAAILRKGLASQLKQGLYREYILQEEELSENNLLNQILMTIMQILVRQKTVKQEHKVVLKKNLVISGLILSTEKGEVKLATFLDDRAMHSLYEKFILEYYRYHHPEYKANPDTIPWDIDDGVIEFLPAMVTDITLKFGERTLIIDAKYYSHTIWVKTLDLNLPFSQIAEQLEKIAGDYFGRNE